MTPYPPVFDQLYSISDIHMGGKAVGEDNFQIFNHGVRLGNFIRHLASLDTSHDIALVLNGDVIDSLAEEVGYVALGEETGTRMMNRIFNDPAFTPVWDGLEAYAKTPRRHLIVIAGNHDIELGLPIVEHMIRDRLTDGDAEANGRIVFSGRGAGYACSVGGARVFCTHGNEGDKWNRVDNEKLGQLARAQNSGRAVETSKWQPNAGTRLVVDVMNEIKREYAFVDLLKPQNASVAAILLTLKRDAFRTLSFGDIKRLLGSMKRSADVQAGLLNIPGSPEVGGPDEDDVAEIFGPRLRELIDETPVPLDDDLLEPVDGGGLSVQPMGGADAPLETMGFRDVVWGLLPGTDTKEAFRRAMLDWVESEAHDDTEAEDWLSKATRELDSAPNFTVTGHTHRARSIAIEEGSSYYFNSGTWIRIFRVTPQALEGPNFNRLWDALQDGSVGALDRLVIDGPDGPTSLMEDFTTAVRILNADGGPAGDLVQVRDAEDGAGVEITSLPRTRREISSATV